MLQISPSEEEKMLDSSFELGPITACIDRRDKQAPGQKEDVVDFLRSDLSRQSQKSLINSIVEHASSQSVSLRRILSLQVTQTDVAGIFKSEYAIPRVCGYIFVECAAKYAGDSENAIADAVSVTEYLEKKYGDALRKKLEEISPEIIAKK